MSQYPIPQFIEEEGKIISFLTFRQFFILVGGGIICIVIYLVSPFFIATGLGLLIAITTMAIAFVRINNESLIRLLFNFLRFTAEKKQYTWSKKEIPYPFEIEKKEKPTVAAAAEEKPVPSPIMKTKKSKLKEIKKIVELKN